MIQVTVVAPYAVAVKVVPGCCSSTLATTMVYSVRLVIRSTIHHTTSCYLYYNPPSIQSIQIIEMMPTATNIPPFIYNLNVR